MRNNTGSRADAGNSIRYTVFNCRTYNFAINIDSVQEVLAHPRLTRVPNAGSHISGVFNLRGKIYSVIDIKRIFEIGSGESSENPMVILIGRSPETLGISVDQVMDMITIEDKEIVTAEKEIPAAFRAYISGYCEKDGARIYLINVASLISHNEQVRSRT